MSYITDLFAELEAEGMIRWNGAYRRGQKVWVLTELGKREADRLAEQVQDGGDQPEPAPAQPVEEEVRPRRRTAPKVQPGVFYEDAVNGGLQWRPGLRHAPNVPRRSSRRW